MSGDVQPRKRRDKRKKKDDLGGDEPKGTAAALGEGDVFMHSYSDHGTGGHWCAKVIFFSLLAVLVTLIGLIILENRGLTDLDASSVQSQYSGVLDGWLEEAPDDDHHDEHTLELNHPVEEEDHDDDDDDEEDDDHEVELEHIEHEPSDVEPISTELPALPEENEDDGDDDDKATNEQDDDDDDDNKADEEDDYLEQDDVDDDFEPYIVERVSAPSGKPYEEVEDSNEVLPADTLAEEDEYEQRQEELRREEAETTHKDGGNSVEEDFWAEEPNDPYWRQQLDEAENLLHQEFLN